MSLNRLSDKLVFNILAGINIGYLEITNYQGEVFKFGNPQDNLKAKLKIKKPTIDPIFAPLVMVISIFSPAYVGVGNLKVMALFPSPAPKAPVVVPK